MIAPFYFLVITSFSFSSTSTITTPMPSIDFHSAPFLLLPYFYRAIFDSPPTQRNPVTINSRGEDDSDSLYRIYVYASFGSNAVHEW